MALLKRSYTASVAKGEGGVTFRISDETPDRDGDVISVSGWQLDDYLKNPVVLFGHDASKPPIGKASGVRIENGALVADVEFTGPDIVDPRGVGFGHSIGKLVEQGFLPAVSVGFMPHEYEPREGGGMRFTKQSLLEFSVVPVPSNPNALQLARAKGLNAEADALAQFVEDDGNKAVDERESSMELKEAVERIEAVAAEVKDAVAVIKAQNEKQAEARAEADFENEVRAIVSDALKGINE